MNNNKHGEGSIYKLSNGKWGAAVSLGTDENGKRIRPTVTGKTKDEVMRKMHDKLVALGVIEEVTYSLSEDQIPSDITVEVFIKHWLLEQSYNVSSRSLRDYAYSLEKFRSMYGDFEMRAVTKQLLTAFFNYCKTERDADGEYLYSQTVLSKFYDRLKAVFASASANGIITGNLENLGSSIRICDSTTKNETEAANRVPTSNFMCESGWKAPDLRHFSAKRYSYPSASPFRCKIE